MGIFALVYRLGRRLARLFRRRLPPGHIMVRPLAAVREGAMVVGVSTSEPTNGPPLVLPAGGAVLVVVHEDITDPDVVVTFGKGLLGSGNPGPERPRILGAQWGWKAPAGDHVLLYPQGRPEPDPRRTALAGAVWGDDVPVGVDEDIDEED